MNRLLTYEQIVTATGYRNLEELVELEIIFIGIDEISSLDDCRCLKKITLIDNGLKRISNLAPVAMTLRSLTLCDQNLTAMENLELPNLRELFPSLVFNA